MLNIDIIFDHSVKRIWYLYTLMYDGYRIKIPLFFICLNRFIFNIEFYQVLT